MSPKKAIRVLAIDPYTRGVGFAVLEGSAELVDWGLKTTGKADNEKAVRIIQKLIERYRPDVLALENWEVAGARRCMRVDLLLNHIASGEGRRVRVQLISGRQIRTIGAMPKVNTKYGRALVMADRFPELQAFLPPVRKPWMSEDNRMSIFDAVVFGVASFPQNERTAEMDGSIEEEYGS